MLSLQTGLTKFTSYVSQFPDLVTQLDNGNYTILAPSDGAFAAYVAAGGDVKGSGDLRALLEYHILQGLHPSLTFDATPQFLPTILTNQTFTNVTGGQVVEVVSKNGTVSIYSAVRAKSTITVPDAIFIGGLIQQIDKVLTIPIPAPATITQAGLNDLIALLNLGGWLTNPVSAQTVIDLENLSCFGANNPQYSSSYTGYEGLDSASLLEVFEYALVAGPVAYSTHLKNGTVLKTLAGKDITVTIVGNDIYLDASRISLRDYITSNGVVQVLDSPLNPNTTNARPTASPVPVMAAGMSSGAKAGIAVGIVAFVIALALLAGLYISLRRRPRPKVSNPTNKSLPPSPKELKGAASFATELDASQSRGQHETAQELDGSSPHRKSWLQPRRTHVVELHSMFSIQASVRRLHSRDTNGS